MCIGFICISDRKYANVVDKKAKLQNAAWPYFLIFIWKYSALFLSGDNTLNAAVIFGDGNVLKTK